MASTKPLDAIIERLQSKKRKPKFLRKELTEEEIEKLSTEEERSAASRWKYLQEDMKMKGFATETDLLVASEAAGILAARNIRLGLIKPRKVVRNAKPTRTLVDSDKKPKRDYH